MSIYREPVQYVKQAVDSILLQSFIDFEFLIVLDDPDNEEMKQYLAGLREDQRVRIFVNHQNMGLAQSMNRLLYEAKGQYLARMDADDRADLSRLEKQLEYMKAQSLDMAGTSAYRMDETGKVLGLIGGKEYKKREIGKILPLQNIFIHPTIMMRKDVVLREKGYRNFPVCQDYDLWLRMLYRDYSMGILAEPLLFFRRHGESVSSKKAFTQLLVEEYIRRLYFERIKSGTDQYSPEALSRYLERHRYQNAVVAQKENEALKRYQQAVRKLKSHHYGSVIQACICLFRSPAVRKRAYAAIQRRLAEKGLCERI